MTFLPLWTQIYLSVLVFLLGLIMGSALNCLAWRMAHGESWTRQGRSHCTSCGHTLGARDLVPLFSWLSTGGKCRYCGEKVSARYPVTELLLGLVYLSVLLRFGITWETLLNLVFVSCLFTLSLIDLDTQEIPNRFLLIPAVCRLVYCFAFGGLSGLWSSVWHGFALGAAILVIVLVMDKVLGKESMGGGDIKLLAVVGLWLSVPEFFLLLICACVIGLVLAFTLGAKKGIAFPFGPAISAAAWICLMIGPAVSAWYLSLF